MNTLSRSVEIVKLLCVSSNLSTAVMAGAELPKSGEKVEKLAQGDTKKWPSAIFVVCVAILLATVAESIAFSVTSRWLQLQVISIEDRLRMLEEKNLPSNPASSNCNPAVSNPATSIPAMNNLAASNPAVSNPASSTTPVVITSCADLPPSSSSGHYLVLDSDGSSVEAYCDTTPSLTSSCGGDKVAVGGGGGWTRVMQLDMRNDNPTQQCPTGLTQLSSSSSSTDSSGMRACVIPPSDPACASVTLPVVSRGYSRVCGRIVGYQIEAPNPTKTEHARPPPPLDDVFVGGIVLMHGAPSQQQQQRIIWSFPAGLDEAVSRHPNDNNCLCNVANRVACSGDASLPPRFVENDFFCDVGAPGEVMDDDVFYVDDSMWDAEYCGGRQGVCCAFNDPRDAWFHKELAGVTVDDMVMRVCRDEPNKDIAIEVVEIYVQ